MAINKVETDLWDTIGTPCTFRFFKIQLYILISPKAKVFRQIYNEYYFNLESDFEK